MGFTEPKVIVVLGTDDQAMVLAHEEAQAIFGSVNWEQSIAPVSPLLPSPMNGWSSFMVGPDGSNWGWEDAVVADASREKFIKWLEDEPHRNGKGYSCIYWFQASCGGDFGDAQVTRKYKDQE